MPRLRPVCLIVGAILIAATAAHVLRAADPIAPKPNVLLLFTDQQTMRAMSAYGNRYVHTPFMDSLAASGARFEISYCTSPVCGPSRSSIVTGRMPHETGVELNGDAPDPAIPNVGAIFRDAGYETAWAGKWHLPKSYPSPPDGTIPGFDYLHVPEGTKFALGDQTDAAVAEAAIAFLKAEHDRPWLLGVSLHNPHDICLTLRVDPAPMINTALFPPLPDNFAVAPDEPGFLADCRIPKKYGVEQQYTAHWGETRWRAYLYTYYRLTEQVDRVVGRILQTLDASGLSDDTLIVFTSDHGEGVAGHQLVVKLAPYDGAASVPMIVRYPGVVPAGLVDKTHPVSGVDIVPTMCDYAGVARPRVTGVSLRPWIEGREGPDREAVVVELKPFREQPERLGRVVRTERYKYMAFTDGARPEILFDMRNDPGETHNLAFDEAHREEVLRHRRLLVEWIDTTEDAFHAPWME